jgi:type 1 fimbriae regulatory protein FimB
MARLKLVAPRAAFDRKVQSETKSRVRAKAYLTDGEVESLICAASQGRHGVRDQLLITLAWRHGLRCEELTGLKLSQINLDARELHVIRVKGSISNHHPLSEDEVRLIKRWLKVRAENKGSGSDCLFLNERGEGLQPHAFNHLLNTIGARAGFTFKLYPHILRHSCGFHLAGRGADAFRIAAYLGHKNIQNSLRYVHASVHGFKNLW